MAVENQIAVIYAVTDGYLDEVDVSRVRVWERGFHEYMASHHQDVLDAIREGKQLTEEIEKGLVEASKGYNETFSAQEETRPAATAAV